MLQSYTLKLCSKYQTFENWNTTQEIFTCPKPTEETPENDAKDVQSQ